MKTPTNSPIINFLNGLDAHTESLSDKEVRQELEDSGIDTAAALTRSKGIIAKHLKNRRTSWMKTADAHRETIESGIAKLNSWVGRPGGEIRAAYEKFIAGLSPQESVACRNKGELSENDMARILDEFAQLRDQDPPRVED